MAIAEAIAPRLPDLTVDDPRPRLIGALAMASVRISIDDWLRDGGSLSDRISRAVNSMTPCPITN
ncbi:acyl-CoA-like ligand-binding transcription factor [Mycolicibacterium gadium]|uniref:acyl-CoA-like ligand-binding transcription factor n=1 Tax=Mycolicibacterium gadium TaxID=1794 RepID=UPI003FD86260